LRARPSPEGDIQRLSPLSRQSRLCQVPSCWPPPPRVETELAIEGRPSVARPTGLPIDATDPTPASGFARRHARVTRREYPPPGLATQAGDPPTKPAGPCGPDLHPVPTEAGRALGSLYPWRPPGTLRLHGESNPVRPPLRAVALPLSYDGLRDPLSVCPGCRPESFWPPGCGPRPVPRERPLLHRTSGSRLVSAGEPSSGRRLRFGRSPWSCPSPSRGNRSDSEPFPSAFPRPFRAEPGAPGAARTREGSRRGYSDPGLPLGRRPRTRSEGVSQRTLTSSAPWAFGPTATLFG